MLDRLSSAIRAHAASLDQAGGQVKLGIVSSFNTRTYCARVVLQPDGVLSGWLPVVSPWTGPGWGLVCPLSPGAQVLVVPQEGDVEQGIVLGSLFSNQQLPPDTPGGECWLVHKSGSYLKLCNDGTIRISGDLHVDGDVFDRHGALSHLRDSYNSHRHPPANATPTPQD